MTSHSHGPKDKPQPRRASTKRHWVGLSTSESERGQSSDIDSEWGRTTSKLTKRSQKRVKQTEPTLEEISDHAVELTVEEATTHKSSDAESFEDTDEQSSENGVSDQLTVEGIYSP